MSSGHGKAAPKSAMPAFGAFPSGNRASMFLEKTNPGIRRSTPDSEALASSDDELDLPRSTHATTVTSIQKPTRRTSWLNEIPTSHRKASMNSNAPYSPTTSHPATPSGDQNIWGTAGSPNMTGGGAWSQSSGFPFVGTWGNDGRKEPPARLQEVLPSPTVKNQPIASFLSDESKHVGLHKGVAGDSAIPFQIPLHPTPKTYRSQSYSVGQLEPENGSMTSTSSTTFQGAGRGRGNAVYTGLTRRPSRPSAIGDRSHDSGTLDRVREVEDDEERESSNGSSRDRERDAAMIEKLTRENRQLKQNQVQSANPAIKQQLRDRNVSARATSFGQAVMDPLKNTGIRGSHMANHDLAIEDFEDAPIGSSIQDAYSSMSYTGLPAEGDHQHFASNDPRLPDIVKRGQWHTALGFDTEQEPPQSRRHSFADVPTRQGSISSTGENFGGSSAYLPERQQIRGGDSFEGFDEGAQGHPHGEYSRFSQVHTRTQAQSQTPVARLEEQKLKLEHLRNRQFAAQYFRPSGATRRLIEESHPSLHQVHPEPSPYGRDVHASTAGHIQPLYVVTFKCSRADVFYIQEGTGLTVTPGDLVIVDADRGTDLGQVAYANVTWDDARQKKEEFAEEHYKWLMMFSRQSQQGGPNAVNPNGLSGMNGAPGSAVGGMGPPGHHNHQEADRGELKPKLIKRLAQGHEIQTLKDKEGNEAKAKRMCQQKVVEHRLNMEILDAEFQMDWKKLTFFYFADTYINFNSLVTDLFKIYKTRIWMSAINPASFITPTASLNLHAIGMHGAQHAQDGTSGRRRHLGLNISQSSPNAFDDSMHSPHGYGSSHAGSFRSPYFNSYQPFSNQIQQGASGSNAYQQMPQHAAEPYSPFMPQQYHMLNPTASSFATSQQNPARFGRSGQQPATDWSNAFQGLSLGS